MANPRISVVIPFHWMDHWRGYLPRCLRSIESQTFKNYELILMKVGSMPITSNRVMEAAHGELVKILYMDDYLAHEDSLKDIVELMDSCPDNRWLVSGCLHDNGDSKLVNYHSPSFNDKIYTGNNTIGSPSVLTMRREDLLLFDEKLSWLLDCDLYKRLHLAYGDPAYLYAPNVVIGLHKGQASNLMLDVEKQAETQYIMKKYA